MEANGWENVRVIEGDARTVALDGMFDGLMAFAAPDVYDSEAAIANLTSHLREGACVVVFGAKLSDRPLGKVLNGVFRTLMKLSFSSTPRLAHEPLSVLKDRLTDIHVREYLMGCMFLAWGTLNKSS